MFYINFADDWIRTTDFWYQKRALDQWVATTATKKYQNFETEYDRFNSKFADYWAHGRDGHLFL